MRPSVSKSGMGGSGHEPEHASVMGSILSSGLTFPIKGSRPTGQLHHWTMPARPLHRVVMHFSRPRPVLRTTAPRQFGRSHESLASNAPQRHRPSEC